ncbi:MAG: HAMP domain-containing histidine kinase [Actinomycetota bacterium]|nr:HAMP domain-containing histidine kinase [Actinomycetota bacterium]
MDTVASLLRRERMIATVRWVAIVFALAQVRLYEAPTPAVVDSAARVRPYGYALVGLLVAIAVAVEVVVRTVVDARRLRIIGTGVLVADVAAAVGFVYLYTFGAVSSQWALLVVLPLEGALRYQLAGALAVWASLVPLYVARELLATRLFVAGVPPGAVFYRLGLLLVVALFAGFIARDLDVQRRLLQKLNDASHQVASRLEPAEILQTLCREAVRCLDACSAVVYVYDGSWFDPVASYPVDELVTIMAEDENEREDASLVPLLLSEPAWLDADGRRPGRLAVPLRWQTDSTTNLLIVRPSRGRPTPFESDVVASLAESAALALATTRVIAAEQRNVRRLRYLEALRTRFVATIAHDLRLPLTVFTGVSRLLRNRREAIAPEQIDTMLASVERQAKRLSRLADDLLDAARLDGERFTLHPETCDLGKVLSATVADVEEDVDVALDGDLKLVGDAARLERVFWNLLSNAEKYGKPPFQVRGWRENGHVKVAVRDHGTGLDPSQLDRLFADFAGSDDAASVGLGLAIVWQLVQAHGGDVAYSDAEPGARFVVSLPVTGPPEETASTAPAR